MPRVFDITVPTNRVKLDDQGRGEVSFTVTNISDRKLQGRAEVRLLESTQKDWLRIIDDDERSFDPQVSHQFTVEINIPPGTPEDAYSFRLDLISVENPDEDYDESQVIAVKRKIGEPEPDKRFPWWIVVAAAGFIVVVVIAIVMMSGNDELFVRFGVKGDTTGSNEAQITIGEPITLAWKVSGAKEAEISIEAAQLGNSPQVPTFPRNPQGLSGEITVRPLNTTAYQVIANKEAENTKGKSFTVRVDTPPLENGDSISLMDEDDRYISFSAAGGYIGTNTSIRSSGEPVAIILSDFTGELRTDTRFRMKIKGSRLIPHLRNDVPNNVRVIAPESGSGNSGSSSRTIVPQKWFMQKETNLGAIHYGDWVAIRYHVREFWLGSPEKRWRIMSSKK